MTTREAAQTTELLSLAWDFRKAATLEEAQMVLSIIAAKLVKLTSEDSCAAFAAMRPPEPTKLSVPSAQRAVRLPKVELSADVSLDEAVDSLAKKLRLVPVSKAEGDDAHD